MAKNRQIPAHAGMIDIETLPEDATVGMDLTRAPGWVAPEMEVAPIELRTPPSNWKDPKKIEAWMVKEHARRSEAQGAAVAKAQAVVDADQAKALETWRRTALDPMKGRVALITVLMGEGGVHVINCAEDEKAGLVELGEYIVDYRQGLSGPSGHVPDLVWVAHNGHGFDFPYLQLRALKHGSTKLASRFHQDKPWAGLLVDTLQWWPQMGGYGKPRGTLNAICAHLGIDRVDNPITGATVLDAYVEGRWKDVVDHGVADVRDLREVYRTLLEVRGG